MWLIDNGANLNEVFTALALEQTILKRAIMASLPEVIDRLLACGRFTQINFQDHNKSTVLHYVCATKADSVLIKRLLDSGADSSIQNNEGDTPLHCLINNNEDMDAIKLLCSNANINLKNRDGSTPLHVAAELQKKEIVGHLISIGADPTAKNNGGKMYTELL